MVARRKGGVGYPVDAASLTALMRSMLRNGERGAVRDCRTGAAPRAVRVSDIRVRRTPRGRMSCAWRRRDAVAAERARSIAWRPRRFVPQFLACARSDIPLLSKLVSPRHTKSRHQ
jgi:hypothetical protein